MRRLFMLVVVLCSASTLAALVLQPVERRIYVAVADAEGRPTPRAPSDAFYIWESGKTREVIAGEPAKQPLSLVLIVHGVPNRDMQDLRRAMRAVVDGLRRDAPDARLAIVSDVETPVLLSVRSSAAAFENEINHFTASASGLYLFEAIEDACKALGREPTDRRAIMVFAHSAKADPLRLTAKHIAGKVRAANVSLWSAYIRLDAGTQVEAMRMNLETPDLLSTGPIVSGGWGQNVIGTFGLPEIASRMTALLASQYAVTYVRPADAGELELRVGVRGPEGQRVLAPTWLVK